MRFVQNLTLVGFFLVCFDGKHTLTLFGKNLVVLKNNREVYSIKCLNLLMSTYILFLSEEKNNTS